MFVFSFIENFILRNILKYIQIANVLLIHQLIKYPR